MSCRLERAPHNSGRRVKEHVDRNSRKRIQFYAAHPELIARRLRELENEWDVERMIETEAPIMTLIGLLLGVTGSRKWLGLPLAIQAMVLVHAVQGHYPLRPVFRMLGVRTEKEIGTERYALKALRGDFDRSGQNGGTREKALWAFNAARLSNL